MKEENKETAEKKEAPKLEAPKEENKPAAKGKLAAIRIRGHIGVSTEKNRLMDALRIYKKNSCSIVNDTPSIRGMLKKVGDQITWGEVDDAAEKELKEKRGKRDSKTFFLNPPRGGFERKGIKAPYSIGGALGYRGKEIIKLIKKMI